jgi:hypothetical protein
MPIPPLCVPRWTENISFTRDLALSRRICEADPDSVKEVIEEVKNYKAWWDFPPGAFSSRLSTQSILYENLKASVSKADPPDNMACRVFRTMDGKLHLFPGVITRCQFVDADGSFDLELVFYTVNSNPRRGFGKGHILEELLSDLTLCFMYKRPVREFWFAKDEISPSEKKRYLIQEDIIHLR